MRAAVSARTQRPTKARSARMTGDKASRVTGRHVAPKTPLRMTQQRTQPRSGHTQRATRKFDAPDLWPSRAPRRHCPKNHATLGRQAESC